jgi:hypothetical protein
MTDSLSAGWRAVYEFLGVPAPDDSDRSAPVRRGTKGRQTTMSETERTPKEPLADYENAVVWFEDEETGLAKKHEGRVRLYPNWVRCGFGHWVPRERVEQIAATE